MLPQAFRCPPKWVNSKAKTLLETIDLKELQPLAKGYRYLSVTSTYAGVPQRWLIIHSQAAQARAAKTVEQQLLKSSEREYQAFVKLCRQAFHCQQDALRALEAFRKTLKVLSMHDEQVVEKRHYGKRGRPAPDAAPEQITYHLQGALAAPREWQAQRIERASLFILASNQLDEEKLPNIEILQAYKNQSKVERGFRFLKDPMFLASTLFLKKVQRVMALLMVMTVCLLVYAALEHRIRTTLQARQASLPDQKGKATQRPTARWVFELFLDVHLPHVVQNTTHTLTMNLKDKLKTLLKLLGSAYQQAYP
jgi:transposase